MIKLFVGHVRPKNVFKLFASDGPECYLKRGKFNRELHKYECNFVNRSGRLFLKSTCLVYVIEE